MENSGFALGIVLLILGMALVVYAVFRSLGHRWTLGIHELWMIPTAGVGLILLGRWLIQ
ncbi:MAG TPA: hypothetical protein VLB29_18260 [Nocardioidaceae bacterium]|nr:hypothetical protein [Nocardioidaceae bacterium]